MHLLVTFFTLINISVARGSEAEDFAFSVYNGFAKENNMKNPDARGIEWTGDFTDKEKNELVNFFKNNNEYDLWGASSVIKSDLYGDEQTEYVVGTLLIKNPIPSRFGEVLCVVSKKGGGISS